MDQEVYRVGIVGLGGIAVGKPEDPEGTPLKDDLRGASHVSAISGSSRTELAAVCDVDESRLKEFERLWGDPWPETRRYWDHRQMLAEERLDVVTVATPDNLHAAIAAAGAGVRGVFSEKPIATSLEDADRMISACEQNHAMLLVDHNWRFMEPFHAIRGALRSGTIGNLSTIIATLGGPRAMLFRNGTHLIDGLVFFAESTLVRASARLEPGPVLSLGLRSGIGTWATEAHHLRTIRRP